MFSSESIEQLNKSSEIVSTDAWKEQSDISGSINLFFEDNFEGNKEEKPKFEPLSDSAEYLSILQKRLARLQNPKVVEQLREKRDQCMRELLEGSTTTGLLTDSQLNLEASIGLTENQTANEIIRFIKPEQPLTAGEVVPIIKHDQLERSTGTEDPEKSDSEVEK